jgi:uncharacterized membrane protein YphA (DoxX/SURF4 family)
MDLALWIVQVVLGLGLVGAGINHTLWADKADGRMAWILAVPRPLMTTIGVLEILGGIGIILPSMTRIAPILTPIAASAVVVLMVLAAAFHVRRNEMPAIASNVVLGALAAFVAFGRFVAAPLS